MTAWCLGVGIGGRFARFGVQYVGIRRRFGDVRTLKLAPRRRHTIVVKTRKDHSRKSYMSCMFLCFRLVCTYSLNRQLCCSNGCAFGSEDIDFHGAPEANAGQNEEATPGLVFHEWCCVRSWRVRVWLFEKHRCCYARVVGGARIKSFRVRRKI